jgi:hypothetical protein
MYHAILALVMAGLSSSFASTALASPLEAYLQMLSHPEKGWSARRSKKQETDPELSPDDSQVRKELSEMLSAYAPKIWLHSQEPYPPSDPIEFIEHSSLHYRSSSGREKLISPEGKVEPRLLAGLSKSTSVSRPYQTGFALNGSGYFLRLEDPKQGARAVASASSASALDVPMFWRLSEGAFSKMLTHENERTGRQRVVIEYWYHTPYNYATRVGIGNHQGDWEGVAMLIELEFAKEEQGNRPKHRLKHHLIASFFAEHETGTWRCSKELTRSNGDAHIEAYSAIGTHATYPEPGAHRSLVFTDHAEKGVAWESWTHLRPLVLEPYYGYPGAWGEPRFFSFMTGPLVPGPGFKSLPRDATEKESLKTLTLLLSRCDHVSE